MPGWFSKATNVFRQPQPVAEQTFEVRCGCGQVHRGLRRVRHQRILCRDCGSPRFVLPRDVYPPPREPKKPPRPETESLPVLAPAEPSSTTETVAEVAVTQEVRAIPGRKAAAATAKPRLRAAQLLVPKPRRFWNPVRIVALGIAIVMASISYLLVRHLQRENAVLVLRTISEQIDPAVEARDWVAARQHFGEAVRAVDILRRDDPLARAYRQGLRETTAINELSSETLVELVEDAERQRSRDPEGWQRLFDARYRNRWIVLETTLSKSSDGGWEIDIPPPLTDSGRGAVLQVDLRAFDRVPGLQAGRPVLFAGQLASCELSSERREWVVRLDRDSGFLWSGLETCLALGFGENDWRTRDELETLLRSQSKSLGLAGDEDAVAVTKSDPPPDPGAPAKAEPGSRNF
ncbi:MAG: hypothetical protein KF774_20795 [Planctomyces sp.]|nr:hypothetical protein [Planctomyces sp.]